MLRPGSTLSSSGKIEKVAIAYMNMTRIFSAFLFGDAALLGIDVNTQFYKLIYIVHPGTCGLLQC